MTDVASLLIKRYPRLEDKIRSEVGGLRVSDPRILRQWLLDNKIDRFDNWKQLVNENSFDALKIDQKIGTLDVYGDSVVGIGGDSAPTTYNTACVAAQLVAISPNLRTVNNQAVSGSGVGTLLTQATNSTQANFALIHTGTNDASILTSVEVYLSSIKALCELLRSEGTLPFVCVPIARDDSIFTNSMQSRFEEYKRALIDEPIGVYWEELIRLDQVDEWSIGGITTNPLFRLGGVAHEGVHPPPEASFHIALKIRETLDNYLLPLSRIEQEAPFSGSGGLIAGTGLSGTVPDGWIGVGASPNAVMTTSADPFTLSFSGTATLANELSLICSSGLSKSTNDLLRGRVVISSSGDFSGLAGMGIGIYRDTGGVILGESLVPIDPTNEFSDLWSGMEEIEFFSPIVAAPANDTYRVCLSPYARQSGALSGSITVHQATLQVYQS